VKQSGGHIFVYSEPDKGSTFKIYFPIVGSAVDPEPPPLPELEREEGVNTILLVEDEDQVRVLARTILRSERYIVLDVTERRGGASHLRATRREYRSAADRCGVAPNERTGTGRAPCVAPPETRQ